MYIHTVLYFVLLSLPSKSYQVPASMVCACTITVLQGKVLHITLSLLFCHICSLVLTYPLLYVSEAFIKLFLSTAVRVSNHTVQDMTNVQKRYCSS